MKNETTVQKKWKTPYNQLDHGKYYEINLSPSETLPDQSMSVQEIMRRYAMGLPLGGGREAVYNDESETLINYERLDKVDKIEVQRRFQQRLKEIQDDLDLQERKKKDAERQDAINQEVEKKLNILKKPSPSGNEDN